MLTGQSSEYIKNLRELNLVAITFRQTPATTSKPPLVLKIETADKTDWRTAVDPYGGCFDLEVSSA